MKNKKEEFGKGIRALLDNIEEEYQHVAVAAPKSVAALDSSVKIPLAQIEVNPFQPRADFDAERLNELAESIKVHGVIQPITVRSLGSGRFQLISGERRLRASKQAGLKEIPAFVREAGDQEMLELALIENIQREDLNAIEVAVNYKRLIDECSLTQEELAARIGKNRTTVTNYLRLLKLPPDIQKGIKEKKIDMGHARAIVNVEDPVLQLMIYKDAIQRGLSVRQVEDLARKSISPAKKKAASADNLALAYRKIQDELSSLFSTKVKIRKYKGEHGEVVITFYSDDDLDRILEVMKPR
ncbi:MAG TPA: ParB/RepB/Spo0J family partition protein [Chitinophagales bacterium]|nr:ParB/RepB/Spo0J family partition protein [Chitinophagales bacterium]